MNLLRSRVSVNIINNTKIETLWKMSPIVEFIMQDTILVLVCVIYSIIYIPLHKI